MGEVSAVDQARENGFHLGLTLWMVLSTKALDTD